MDRRSAGEGGANMGKRKSAKKVAKKARPKVMGSFDCMYCHHTGSIRITM